MIRTLLTILFCTTASLVCSASDTTRVGSPDGKITVKIWADKQLHYEVLHRGKIVLEKSDIDLILQNGNSLSVNNKIISKSLRQIDNVIDVPIPEKRETIIDKCNELTIKLKNSYSVKFRVYNDGVAYRISSSFKDPIVVANEIARFNFPAKSKSYFSKINKREDADIFHTAFEEECSLVDLEALGKDSIAYLPTLVTSGDNPVIAIVESDLEDYPGMFLRGCGSSSLEGVFAGYPLRETLTKGEYPDLTVTERAEYIAKRKGTGDFPWRIIVIAEHDRDLPGNDIVYRLASPSRIGDTSWLHGVKGTDEWISDINLFGVPFKSGVNTDTYKYYIDFAKKFGFSHIMMDAGWSAVTDLFSINPAVDMDEIASYAKKNNVKLCMWTLAYELDRNLEKALYQFNSWGVDCIMTDFINRDDQLAVNFYFKVAKACAEHKILVMFHGAFPMKGFNRTYPNAAGREGVLGSEYNIWSERASPRHNVTLAFTRMLAGPMDYEPGLMNNSTKEGFRMIPGMVMSQGTRCHQLSMFVVYDSPIQLFSGNPSQAALEPEFTKFLASIPTTWDETIIQDAKIGEYIITVRKKGADWYVAGMNSWQARDCTVEFDFLTDGKYTAKVCKDGINADRYAADYTLEEIEVVKDKPMKIHMAPGGGFVVHLVKSSR